MLSTTEKREDQSDGLIQISLFSSVHCTQPLRKVYYLPEWYTC